MKIINVMINRGKGGIEQAFLDYNQALTLHKHQVYAVISNKAKIKQHLKNQKVEQIIEIPFLHYNYFLVFSLYKQLKRISPDIIIVHNKKAIPIFKLVARLLGAKIIGVSHNPKYKQINKCDGIFTITQYQKDIFTNKGFSSEKIFVIPNLISTNIPYKAIQQFHTPPVIGTMGRFDPMKGFPDFIIALSLLKKENIPFRAIIGGEIQKSYKDEYEKIVKLVNSLKLEKDILFSGWVDNKEKFYEDIDIFVLPSRFEPVGIVLLEAMMYSKPIIASLAEGPAEIFSNTKNTALLFPINSPSVMAEKIKEALQNFQLSQEMAQNGYNLCQEKYTINKVAEELNNALSYFIKER